jgi:hypothetical protein
LLSLIWDQVDFERGLIAVAGEASPEDLAQAAAMTPFA